MTDETAKIEHGDQAAAILNSTAMQQAFERLRAIYIEAWIAAKTVDTREDAHRFVLLIDWLKQDLQSVATTGNLTRQRLKAIQGGAVSLSDALSKWSA